MRLRWPFLRLERNAVLCALLAYFINYNTLDAEFTYDDSRAILSNPDVLPSTPLSRLWKNDFWGTAINSSNSHGSYRPLSVLTFRFNYWLSEFRPWSYHFFNVVLHSISTYLVFTLGKSVLPSSTQTTATLLFAVHPVHCEAVASVVGRADILANVFFILSFLCYIEHVKLRNKIAGYVEVPTAAAATVKNGCIVKNGHRHDEIRVCHKYKFNNTECNSKVCRLESLLKKICQFLKLNIYLSEMEALSGYVVKSNFIKEWSLLAVSLVLATMAMLSKETGVTVLAVCAAYDLVKTRHLLQKRYYLYRSLAILSIAMGGLLIIRFYVTDGNNLPTFASSDNPVSKSKSFFTRTLTFLYLPVFNFTLLLCPSKLSFDWSMDAIPQITSIFDSRNILTFGFYTVGCNFVKTCLLHTVFNSSADRIDYKSKYHEKAIAANGICASSKDYWTPKMTRTSSKSSNGFAPTKNGFNHLNGFADKYNGHAHAISSAHRKTDQRRYYEIYLISISLLVLPFLPATNLFFYVGFVVAERILYIPSVGYCFFIAVSFDVLQRRFNFKYFRVLFSLFIIVLSAKTILRNEDWHDEESLYKSGVEINPPKAYANLGSILSSQGRIEEAEQALKLALKYRSNMADAHYNLGILQHGKEQYEEAINSYKMAIHYRPMLAQAHLNLGQLLASLGKCEDAEVILRRCASLDGTGVKDPISHESTKISALLHLGRLMADRGRYNEAITIYREAVDSLPENYQPQVLYNLLGEALFHVGELDEAEKWHLAAMEVKPTHVATHLMYGRLLAKNRSRIAEAEQRFLKAQELAPEDPNVHQHYGQFLSQNRRYNEAAQQYLLAMKSAPTEYDLIIGAATAFRHAGRGDKAEQLYRQALSLKPMDPGAHVNLGAMLHLNGKFQEATVYYRAALKLDPHDELALENMKKLIPHWKMPSL
ncbi:protein O-mannosyl-transferase TMTC2-like [Planococcus citri]|uniref:protein O-mannosyl-transferase TMTC2-like n=1 Tax=Planococcus citri TaxID=170843 RepID=UPI0031F758C6